jgi:hypothetical protein
MDGRGVVLITLIILVVIFSAASSDAEVAMAKAMITKSEPIQEAKTVMVFLIKFNILCA